MLFCVAVWSAFDSFLFWMFQGHKKDTYSNKGVIIGLCKYCGVIIDMERKNLKYIVKLDAANIFSGLLDIIKNCTKRYSTMYIVTTIMES